MPDTITVNITEVAEAITVTISEARDAYQLAVAGGFAGTREEWLASLQGEPGGAITGPEIVAAITAQLGSEDWQEVNTGPAGADGAPGADSTVPGPAGADGTAGPNAVSTSTTTAINALLKGDGAHVAAAVPGADYLHPSTLPADFATQSAAAPAAGTFSGINCSSFTAPGNINFDRAIVSGLVVSTDMVWFGYGGPQTFYFRDSGSTDVAKMSSRNVGGGAGLELPNVTSLGSVSGGARIGAISGEMCVLDSSGNVTVISPHAKDAPADLYEIAPGVDEMERKANIYLATVRWWNVTRRQIIDRLDLASRLGATEESAAAWAAVFDRRAANTLRCEHVETFAEYETRTGTSLSPGDTPEARAEWLTLSPAERWAKSEADYVSKSEASRAAWAARKALAEAAQQPLPEPEPALYEPRIAPDWIAAAS